MVVQKKKKKKLNIIHIRFNKCKEIKFNHKLSSGLLVIRNLNSTNYLPEGIQVTWFAGDSIPTGLFAIAPLDGGRGFH